MMMGVQNVRESPAVPRERRLYRAGLGRVDDRAELRIAVTHEIGVIVPQAGDEFDFEGRHGVSESF
jgi:hypothetical protein